MHIHEVFKDTRPPPSHLFPTHSRWTQQTREKTRVKRQQVILSRRGTHALINHERTKVDKYNVFIPIDSNRKQLFLLWKLLKVEVGSWNLKFKI